MGHISLKLSYSSTDRSVNGDCTFVSIRTSAFVEIDFRRVAPSNSGAGRSEEFQIFRNFCSVLII